MLEYILITTGPIAAALFVFAVFRLRRKATEMEVIAEYHFDEDESIVVDEAEVAGRHWRRSYIG